MDFPVWVREKLMLVRFVPFGTIILIRLPSTWPSREIGLFVENWVMSQWWVSMVMGRLIVEVSLASIDTFASSLVPIGFFAMLSAVALTLHSPAFRAIETRSPGPYSRLTLPGPSHSIRYLRVAENSSETAARDTVLSPGSLQKWFASPGGALPPVPVNRYPAELGRGRLQKMAHSCA